MDYKNILESFIDQSGKLTSVPIPSAIDMADFFDKEITAIPSRLKKQGKNLERHIYLKHVLNVCDNDVHFVLEGLIEFLPPQTVSDICDIVGMQYDEYNPDGGSFQRARCLSEIIGFKMMLREFMAHLSNQEVERTLDRFCSTFHYPKP